MAEHPAPPRRVRITSPRTGSPRRAPVRPTREIDEQTGIGQAYMRSLVRVQLRAGLTVVVTLAVLVGGLPLVFAVVPSLRAVHVVGVPLPWVALGLGVYPLLIGLGWWYVRSLERAEREFTELLHR